jgi:hypothetical protein
LELHWPKEISNFNILKKVNGPEHRYTTLNEAESLAGINGMD